LQVNAVPATQAFTPGVNVRGDGLIGVTYYDLRNNTASTATLPADLWLTSSTDAISFSERHVAGFFDMDVAPNAEGLFLGDYMGLASNGNDFLPFFAMTNNSAANRTDIFAVISSVMVNASRRYASAHSTGTDANAVMTPAWQRRAHNAIVRTMERRIPNWHGVMHASGVLEESIPP
jgi:hypothetical protein